MVVDSTVAMQLHMKVVYVACFPGVVECHQSSTNTYRAHLFVDGVEFSVFDVVQVFHKDLAITFVAELTAEYIIRSLDRTQKKSS